MKKFELRPGHELRGFRIRLYPDKEQEARLLAVSEQCRLIWNWLVRQTDDVIAARGAYAVAQGLVAKRPERPNYDGLTPEAAKSSKEAHAKACFDWSRKVHEATKKDPACAYRNMKDWLAQYGDRHDYQLFSRVLRWQGEQSTPGAHVLQALAKNWYSKGHKRRRKRSDVMPLRVRSGECFAIGDFGTRRSVPFYNCQIKFCGLRIRGRLPGKTPEGRVIEGVAIRKESDGWWASIRVEAPVRMAPQTVPGSVVGIDVGLVNIAAMSTGARVESNLALHERIVGRQALGKSVARLQTQAARNALHTIYNEIVKPLANVETIVVERLDSDIGQRGSRKVSRMRKVVELLRSRYGERVREVEPHYTSQECSQCGHRSKESWSYEHGRYGQCPICGYSEDRDVNAARNIARRYRESLQACAA